LKLASKHTFSLDYSLVQFTALH